MAGVGLSPLLLGLALVLAGTNLRPALTSLGPVLPDIVRDLNLDSLSAGLLTTAPVLCLGLFAPPAARLSHRWGSEATLVVVLVLLALGTALRGLFDHWGLFSGALLAGAAIGIAGSIMPGIVKRDFPKHPDLMTGVYTMSLCLGASIAAGSTVPLFHLLGDSWRGALAFWALPALLTAAIWLPMARQSDHRPLPRRSTHALWRNPIAWQVTFYMGLQSSLAYIVFGWLPSILQSRGLTPLEAGFMLSMSVLVQLTTALSGPWIATRGRDQRAAICVMLGLTLTGLLACLYAPMSTLWFWIIFLGLGMGGIFSIALVLIVLRAEDTATASELSGMVQGVGYCMASLGPLLAGQIPTWFGSWDMAGVLFTVIVLAAVWAGWGAGKDRLIRF